MKTAEEYLYQHIPIETSNGNDAFRVDDCLEAMRMLLSNLTICGQ